MDQQPIKVYLAGPDMFRVNALEHMAWQKQQCEQRGLVPMHPLDNDVDLSGEPIEVVKRLYGLDIKMMLEADVICANMNEFLGAEPDSGTSFEMGFFAGFNYALQILKATQPQKYIYAFVDHDKSYHQKIHEAGLLEHADATETRCGWRVSSAEMYINLMMEVAAYESGAFILTGYGHCLDKIKADLIDGHGVAQKFYGLQ